MIHEVDESLRMLMRREALQGADIEIVFDAPTKDWAGRRNTPTIDVYLYDVREDAGRRSEGHIPVRGADGFITARQRPPRYYKLSYLVTAWTQRAEDEHRLLSAVLAAFVKYEAIPADILVGSLGLQGKPIYTTIALPPPQDRSIGDIWSAMGGELKPSLDLVVHAPFDPGIIYEAGPPVLEAPSFGFTRPDADDPIHQRGRTSDARVAALTGRAAPAPRGARNVFAGRDGGPRPDEPAVKGRGKRRRGEEVDAEPEATFIPDANDDPATHAIALQAEEILLSNPQANGRVFRMRGLPRKT